MKLVKKIKYHIDGAASPHGFHNTESFMECPRRSRLDSEVRLENVGLPYYISVDDGAGIGTLYHGYQALFYTRRIRDVSDLDKVEFTGVEIDPLASIEVRRLMTAYIDKYGSPDQYGEILGSEILLPRDNAEAVKIEATIGRTPWTGRLDLITRLNEGDVSEFTEIFDMSPGVYVIDFKAYQQERALLQDELVNSLQIKGYMLAWNAIAGPDLQVQGGILDVCIKTKIPKFRRWLVPAPTERDIAILHKRHAGLAVVQEHLKDWPNVSSHTCFGPYRICQHWLSGRCNQI